ncbi:hypothetical protein DVK85_09765 [Flavobacterium arcticum]|uniref:Gliding motility protein GldL-like N-terminal domain-containing protein n=1 Tax=Flavobacterium arcticum TaxID=1784713 RepID=A0A345HD45_9FLAO|nr:hypothetical protein [Flavobacterium arcticum]AXG74505.1 hypothetical protein DVK85_09765 [Flavobacterium arcticum]KAF2512176.1 hypothetical protein E0W72_03895 [Flavobacterium arcticum]
MIVSEEQIEYIATNLEFYGITSGELKEDLLDHICTQIETGNYTDFETAYQNSLQTFGGHHAIHTIQRETYTLTTMQKSKRRQKLVYISAYISATLIALGSLFKIMHWPMASILLALGFIVLILLFFPAFFYHRYKSSEIKLYE